MKKNFVYAMMSAIALTGAVSFSACSTSEEDLTNTPTIEKEDIGKGVATRFALNLSQTQGPSTRSTPNAVQLVPGTNPFRGMSNIWLIPMNFAQDGTPAQLANSNYSVSVAGQSVAAYGPTQNFSNNILGTTWSTIVYHLGDILNTEISEAHSSKVYSMTLPVGTSNFLFYGKASYDAGTSDGDKMLNYATYGVLNSTLSQNVANAKAITFELQPIYSSTPSNSITEPMSSLLTILNGIESADAGTPYGTWRALSTSDENSERTLKSAYNGFAGTKEGEVRAGSAEAIRATVQELYRTILAQSRVGQTAKVKAIAKAVRDKIESYFDVYFSADPATAFSSDAVASANIDELDGGNYKNNYYEAYLKYKGASSTNKSLWNFPIEQGLPSGAARLLPNAAANPVFSYAEEYNTGVTTGNTGNDITMISYPAELAYFANSALRATEKNKEVKDYPITVASWDANSHWTDWPLSYVTTDTRAVAMKNNVNFGVALMKTVVKLPSTTSLADNRAKIVSDGITTDKTITIDGHSFIMTGIVIGGQPDKVGWDFLPTSTGERNHVVYDRILSKDATNGVYSAPTFPDNVYTKTANDGEDYCFVTTAGTPANYTMLLDNFKAETATDQVTDIAVAIELVNNTGQEFYGRDNIIPVGGTFYLTGKLTFNPNETHTVDWTSYTNTSYTATPNVDYTTRIPAYGIDRIFIQDHTTEVTFTLTTDALKHAYSTIPDLRSIQMLFGLSVDLKWLKGLEFNVSDI